MRYKKIMMLTIILAFLLAVSAASAAENVTDDVVCVEDRSQAIEQLGTDEITGADDEATFTSLQNRINNASAGSTIILERDYVYDEGFSTDGIVISKDITIDGNGHTLNGLSKSRIFKVEYNSDTIDEYYSIALNNITFKNAYAYDGGVIYMGCKAVSNSFSGPWHPKHCNVKINNCIFADNEGYYGGTVYSPSYMWGHGQENHLTINNSVFTNNHAYCGGAIEFYNGNLKVINSIFINNSAGNEGGAVYSWGGSATHAVNNCTFTANKAEYGGAIYCWSDVDGCYMTLKIVKSKFIENQPLGKNGAIYASEKDVECTIASCTFIDSTKTAFSASEVTANYGVSKRLVVTLKDGVGNILKSKKVRIKVATISETLTTNNKGQVSVDISSLVPKTYTASIKFAGDDIYKGSTASVKVTVKKATPKLSAPSKAYKVKAAKNYIVTLKTNQNKVMKNSWITLNVNKKTYKVKTNAKGQATFKITNLKKKGTFTAVVKYAGNKYYNAKNVKPKIIVK